MEMCKVLLLSDKDNVVTFMENGREGDTVLFKHQHQLTNIKLRENISFGHKMTIKNIKKGENIIKYGEVMGRATEDIPQGYHAHVHNIESLRVRFDLVKGDKS